MSMLITAVPPSAPLPTVRLRVVTAFSTYSVGQILERPPDEAERMCRLRWYGRALVEKEEADGDGSTQENGRRQPPHHHHHHHDPAGTPAREGGASDAGNEGALERADDDAPVRRQGRGPGRKGG